MRDTYRWLVGVHSVREIHDKYHGLAKRTGDVQLVVDSTFPNVSYIEWKP